MRDYYDNISNQTLNKCRFKSSEKNNVIDNNDCAEAVETIKHIYDKFNSGDVPYSLTMHSRNITNINNNNDYKWVKYIWPFNKQYSSNIIILENSDPNNLCKLKIINENDNTKIMGHMGNNKLYKEGIVEY